MDVVQKLKGHVRRWMNSPPPEAWLKHVSKSQWFDYEAWLFRHAFISRYDWVCQRNEARRSSVKPYLTVLIPVYNVNPDYLRECVNSVLIQTYPYWEICLVDDASSKDNTLAMLSNLQKYDRRIRVYFKKENHGICRTTNFALSKSRGEFIVFLDHDDRLAPDALWEVARAIGNNPEIDIIYSDRDMLDENGLRYMHLFKPDWAPETLLSGNYICHLTVYRRSLLQSLGGLDESVEGSQDYDLILRAAEMSPVIHHVPRILYHWRQHAGSVSLKPEAKDYAYAAASVAIEKALKRRKISGKVEQVPNLWRGNYRVRLVPKGAHTRYVKNLDLDEYFNLADVVKRTLNETDRPYLVFLGPGVTAGDEALIEMVSWFHFEDIAMVSGRIADEKGMLVHAGLVYGPPDKIINQYDGMDVATTQGYMAGAATVHNVSLPHPGCFALRRDAAEALTRLPSGLDGPFAIFHLGLKLVSQGKRILFTPFAPCISKDPELIDYSRFVEQKMQFVREWQRRIHKGDPYYNPNLTLDKTDLSLNFNNNRF